MATQVIPPDGYISPSRSTSTVTSGDLGDISASFSSGSFKVIIPAINLLGRFIDLLASRDECPGS